MAFSFANSFFNLQNAVAQNSSKLNSLIHSQNRKTKGNLHMTTSDKELYKCWASLKEDRVVGIVSMRAPAHIDFSY